MATAANNQAAQIALANSLVQQVDAVWPIIEIDNLNDSLPKYNLAVAALVQRYSQAGSALAVAYYEEERRLAKVPGKFQATPAEPAGLEQVSKGLDWATKGLWSKTPDVAASKKLAASSADRYMMNAGRDTIIHAANTDRQSNGWARIIHPDESKSGKSCSFCLLLATRGVVYRSEQSAEFKAHNDCHCTPQAVFNTDYEPSAEVRQAQQIYNQAKRTAKGPAATRRAFRRAIESQ